MLGLSALLMACGPEVDPLPDDSGNTENTGRPGRPDKPDTPDTPETPDTPDTPETPDTPDTPDTPEVPEEPQEAYYVKVAESYNDWSGDYLITYSTSSSVIVFSSYGDTKGQGIEIGSYVTTAGIHSSNGDQYKAVITKAGSNYTINITGVGSGEGVDPPPTSPVEVVLRYSVSSFWLPV